MQRRRITPIVLLLVALLGIFSLTLAQDDLPPADIANDEGGPETISGSVTYTNGFIAQSITQPIITLEDQSGFVTRDVNFIMSEESQVPGHITSDVFTSPFTYTIDLPIEPDAALSDVDNDGEEDTGVMIYAVVWRMNTWGDPYIEERDFHGWTTGGWADVYSSIRVDPNPSAGKEVLGGKYLVYAPDDQQGFPSSFGDDGKLFTDDDPTIALPQGYTIVDLDTDPFTFDRAGTGTIDVLEGESAEQADFSAMSYTDAFDALIELFRKKYAYTDLKEIDWDAKKAEFRPRFEEAEANNDSAAYQLALRDFIWSIPDAHLSAPFDDVQFAEETGGGLGMAIRELDDGRVLVNFILEDGPADQAGIELRAQILEINGELVDQVVSENVPWSSPFSSEHTLRLQQLRYAIRFPVDTEVEVTYQNPGDAEPTTTTLTTIAERDSFSFSSFNRGLTGDELPVEYEVMDNGYGYVKIYSFFDNSLLTVQLWERMIQTMNAAGVPGLIVDMRQNGGGDGYLADQMAAYFFDERLPLGGIAFYDENADDFLLDPATSTQSVFVPPPEELRYHGAVAVLVGPSCSSACEFFSYNMTAQDRATIVGQYPSGGLAGGQTTYLMPEDVQLQYSFGRGIDADGNIIIEGTGVVPTVTVPVDEETLFSEGDPVLDAAVVYLDEATAIDVQDAGEISLGDTVTGELVARQRVRYTLTLEADTTINILLTDEAGELDTYLRLYDTGDNLLIENDDADEGTGVNAPNSAFTELEVPGGFTIVIEVATFEDSGAGTYTLQVTEAGSAPSEEPSPEATP